MNKKKVYILEDRGILFLQGKDTKEFLQNLITNDIDKVNETNSCFASLLTPQGKYLFDFLIIKHKNGYFIDCEKLQIENLYNQLDLYKLRSKVEILNLSNEFVVAALSNEKFLEFDGAKNLPGLTIKYREDPIFLDPRKKELGARIIINLEKLYLIIFTIIIAYISLINNTRVTLFVLIISLVIYLFVNNSEKFNLKFSSVSTIQPCSVN